MSSPTLRDLLLLAWPVVVARATQAVIGFSDALMIASWGESALAATTTGSLNVIGFLIFPMGTVFIVQSFASQLSGQGDLEAARRYGYYGLLIAVIAGIISILCSPLLPVVLSWGGYEPDVEKYINSYMLIRLWSVLPSVGLEAMGNWYGGLGITQVHMYVGIFAMLLNIFLNWVLIDGNLGFEGMGVVGAALASTIASFVAFIIFFVIFYYSMFAPKVSNKITLYWSEFVRTLKFGLPNGGNWFLEMSALILFVNIVMTHLGTAALAAVMVVLNINSVSFMPAFGLGSAGAILSGQAIGHGRLEDVSRVVRLTLWVTGIWQTTVGLIYFFFPQQLMALFSDGNGDGAALMQAGVTMLLVSAAWQLFDAFAITLSETLRAAGDSAWPMWARLILAWVVFVPSSVISVMWFDGGVVAAMVCFAGYIVLLAFALAWRFWDGQWKQIDLTGKSAHLDIVP